MSEKLKLFMREYHRAGRYGYSAVDADHGGATIITGITRKLADNIIGIISNEINQFCRINRLATLLNDLQNVEVVLSAAYTATAFNSDNQPLTDSLKRVLDWIHEHQDGKAGLKNDPSWATNEPERIAYLSLDNERYDLEAQARKQKADSDVPA